MKDPFKKYCKICHQEIGNYFTKGNCHIECYNKWQHESLNVAGVKSAAEPVGTLDGAVYLAGQDSSVQKPQPENLKI